MRRITTIAATAATCLLLAACSSTSSSSSSTSTTKADDESMKTTTSAAPVGGQVTKQTPDDATETQILAAIASYNKLTPADYQGLSEGSVYLAEDGGTGYQYAGAQPIPSMSSTAAQVASQDEGSYLILEKAPGQSWTVMAPTGLMATCPANTPPAAVVAVWGWKAGTCNPSS